MVKLYGSVYSNYYNKVRIALIAKEIEFEEILTLPSQDADYLLKSNMGKIPCLEHDGKFISESVVILEYLEEAFAKSKPLLPEDPYERSLCRQVQLVTDLYIDLPLRPFYRQILEQGKTPKDEAIDKVIKTLNKAAISLNNLVDFEPYVIGSKFTLADCAAAANWYIPGEVLGLCNRENPMLKINNFEDYMLFINKDQRVKDTVRKRKVLDRARKIAAKKK